MILRARNLLQSEKFGPEMFLSMLMLKAAKNRVQQAVIRPTFPEIFEWEAMILRER